VNSVVCTLFEGSYHYGLAALTNSLYANGFRGEVLAGYRGDLPPWSGAAKPAPMAGWSNARALAVADGLSLVFLPLQTDHHLTNHKPTFMLRLLDGPAKGADALFYLDPDICVSHAWPYFEDWVSCGVALCEDVNSPLPENHPRRIGWRRYYQSRGLPMHFRGAEYVNGGFVGVRRAERSFLEVWERAMLLMVEEIGSLSLALTENQSYKSTGFANCFDRTDQDGLNAAIEATDTPVSVIGQEAMALKPGPALLPHALGGHKPWTRSYLRFSLKGVPPRLADHAYWQHVRSPIALASPAMIRSKWLELSAAALIGRFFRRV
jgi:hypothetical protein